MPFTPESYKALDNAINRLAAETILAQPGRDDGLVPAYSLLADLCDLCSSEPAMHGPVMAAKVLLEKHLDEARPFDEATLATLGRLVEWLPEAFEAVRAGTAPAPYAAGTTAPAPVAAAAATTVADAAGHGTADVLLTLSLEDNRELLSEFHGEAVDHLQQIEAALLMVDHNPDNPEALNSIFRSFHTIKGNAGFLGLVPMQSLAHEVESLLDLARNHKLRLNAAIITEILHSRDALQELTQQIAHALETGVLPNEIVPVSHLIAAVKVLAANPDAPIAEPASAPVEHLPVSVPLPEMTGAHPGETIPAMVEAIKNAAPGKAAAAAADNGGKSGGTGTVRVNTEKLDSLMDVVGELVIVQSQLLESTRQHADTAGSPLLRNVAQLTRITKELQHTAMSLRMIPIKPSFQKMERLVRDLARDFGKKVDFVTSGEDTELDRTVVEEIADPLVHMVRNALDHGLELPEARVTAGKSDTGTLHLKAYHQGSNIVIELQDDGKGIDPDRIYRKAVEKGVVQAGAVLSRDEMLALIFAPGLSTAEKVTAVSGRGVGMDVVKRNIDKLRGKIEIASEVGKGSTFKIKLPLTMAIIDGLVVRVGEDRFILPSTSVQRALRPTRESISTIHGRGEVLDLRGRLVPVHRLHERFGIPHQAENPWDGIVVIVEHSGKISALLVDEMVSKQEVVIKNLGAFMQGLPGVAGGAILGDGNIALILDPGTLLQAA